MEHTNSEFTEKEPENDNFLGIIYGNISTNSFHFAVHSPSVSRGTFVKVEHEHYGHILGYITEVERKTNISFLDARRRLETNDNRREMDGEGRVSARVSVFGYRNQRNILNRLTSPLEAGIPVFRAENHLIRQTIGLGGLKKRGAYMGLLRGHKLEVELDINQLVQKHVAVIARTGSGKSYTVGVLVEELVEKNIPVVIIDRHGEYSSMVRPNLRAVELEFMNKFAITPQGYPSQMTIFSPGADHPRDVIPLTFDERDLGVDEVLNLTGMKRSGSELGILHRAIRTLSNSVDGYIIEDIICQAEISRDRGKWKVIDALERLRSHGIFSLRHTPLTRIVRKGQCSVIDLKGIPSGFQEVVVAKMVDTLHRERKRENIPPFIMILEEAHNFCPQQGYAVSTESLINVASEGRKFGFGLCIVTQRPARVDKNLLSQCNTQIILKVTNTNDLKAITASVEGISQGATEEIQRLAVGEALVMGGNIALPIYVQIRIRKSRHGGDAVSVIGDLDEVGDSYNN